MSVEHKIEQSGEIAPKLSPEQAQQELFGIWYRFALAGETGEAMKARLDALDALSQRLSPEAEEFLEKVKEGGPEGSLYTNGLDIRIQARAKAQFELFEKRRTAEEARTKSKGERRAIRRGKANKRRGTNPRLIH